MNSTIRDAVKKRLKQQGKTQTQVAAELGLGRTSLRQMLNAPEENVPDVWQRLLDAAGLELTVTPKSEELSAAGVPYTGDPETDAVLDEHPDILERIARLRSGEVKVIPWEEAEKELGF